jgi:hypothetical protein
MQPAHFTINVPHVVHETIDGETILIHLGSGTYYSLEGTAADVWELLDGGVERAAIVASIARRHDADRALVQAGVDAFVQELIDEDLLIGVPGALVAPGSTPPGRVGSPAGRFAAPVLCRYTDMQEFLLVDPLHDVDEGSGWPHAKVG